MKIALFAGTRPEVLKLGPVYKALQADQRYQKSDISFILTGQHDHIATQAVEDLEVFPHSILKFTASTQNLSDKYTDLQKAITSHLIGDRPDLVIVQGDTLSAFAAAHAAALNKIPVAHVEAGLRSGDNFSPFPEELNRRLIAALATLNFAPTQSAADALKGENIAPTQISITGNTIIDALNSVKAKGKSAFQSKGNHHKRILVTCHRRENWGQGFNELIDALSNVVAQRQDIEAVLPLHPNPLFRTYFQDRSFASKSLRAIAPLPYADFIQTLSQSDLVITDSGGVQEEATCFHVPTLIIRDTTERREALKYDHMRLCPTKCADIARSTLQLLEKPRPLPIASSPFGDGFASQRIATALYNWHSRQAPYLPDDMEFKPSCSTTKAH